MSFSSKIVFVSSRLRCRGDCWRGCSAVHEIQCHKEHTDEQLLTIFCQIGGMDEGLVRQAIEFDRQTREHQPGTISGVEENSNISNNIFW